LVLAAVAVDSVAEEWFDAVDSVAEFEIDLVVVDFAVDFAVDFEIVVAHYCIEEGPFRCDLVKMWHNKPVRKSWSVGTDWQTSRCRVMMMSKNHDCSQDEYYYR
jgi:hypothetical protein